MTWRIDHASNGRLELSLGAAWHDKEHIELGIPFPSTGERFDRLEDALEIVTRLFSGEEVSYEGKTISLQNARVNPKPVQSPHPPIWMGGSGPKRTIPLVAKYADVWHTWGSPKSLAPLNERIDELAEANGRKPSDIMRATSLSLDDLDQARKFLPKWVEAGYGYLHVGWPDAGEKQIEAFVKDVMPEYL